MNYIKAIIKKIISKILKIIIPIVEKLSFEKNNLNYLKYEEELKKIYNPPAYEYHNYKNKENNSKLDLSIIIPVYNREKFLSCCLDSIEENKTQYCYEIIAIDDGSTDNSLKILKDYSNKYKNIKIIKEQNQGAAAARNNGLNNATGKYVTFIDSDDYISNDFIEKLLTIATINDCDIVNCGYYIKNNNKLVPKYGKEIITKKGLSKEILSLDGFLCMKIIKRELLFDVRLPEGYWYEDIIVRPLILNKCKKFIGIKECLYYYRQHSSNISKVVEHTTNYKCLSQYYLISYIIDYATKINISINDTFKQILFYEYTFMLYNRTLKLPKDVRKKVFYLSSNQIENLKLDYLLYNDNFINKYYYKAFIKKDFMLYNLVSKYKKWSGN